MNALAHAPRFYAPASIPVQSGTASYWGEKITQLVLVATSHARNNATDWRTLTHALIEQVALEHQSPDWDGYGAVPISMASKTEAQRLVEMLPYWYPAPEAVPDPDGEIALSWDFGLGHVFTLSVGSTGALSYAGLLGDGVKRHGVEPFKGDVPKSILEAIEELCYRSPAIG
jgi:hypothetical protein